jgi:hypothetical protein
MPRWIVVTTGLKVAVVYVVEQVIERTEMDDGHVQWLVASQYSARQLMHLVPGVISVEPAPTQQDAEGHTQAA